ncbi:uncharacterized protein [Antedon mediterranea]|uniref:uncharacterized protein isoform X5 n=1 Tax=Antedon mediterranea TaxID=105859 RepID=UPI003AF65058
MAAVAPPEELSCCIGMFMPKKRIVLKKNSSSNVPQVKPILKPVRVVPLRYSKSSVWNALHSANSPYGHQELPTTSPLTNSSQLDTVRSISDDLHNLERKLEKERDRRTNTDSLGVAKFETKVLGDENMEGYKRNSFRPSARGTFFAREHYLSPNSNTFTNISNDNSLAMGALAITAPPSATSRKQQQSVKDLRTQPSQTLRSRGMLPMARERAKPPKYVYSDAVSGATPAFQQRISELTTLENETLRYERTRKLKKKTKQDRD